MLDDPLCELYSAPPETFPCRAVVQNSDGGVSIVPSTNGRPLAVLTVADLHHGAGGGTEPTLALPKPGCCMVQ